MTPYQYPNFYKPRPVRPLSMSQGSSGNVTDDEVRKMVMEALKMQAEEGAASSGGMDGAVSGGAAGAGGYAALAGGGEALAAPTTMASGFSTPSLLAPEIAAIDIGGSGAAAATPTAGLSTMGYALPAAFVAAGPVWAPSVAKAGSKLAQASGLIKKKPNRKYKSEEVIKSKVLGRQISGFDKLSDEQKTKIANAANSSNLLRMPGSADKEGNTKDGIGMDLIKPRFTHGPDYWKDLKNRVGAGSAQYHLQTTPIEELAKEGRDENLNKFIKTVEQIKSGNNDSDNDLMQMVPRPIYPRRN